MTKAKGYKTRADLFKDIEELQLEISTLKEELEAANELAQILNDKNEKKEMPMTYPDEKYGITKSVKGKLGISRNFVVITDMYKNIHLPFWALFEDFNRKNIRITIQEVLEGD